MRTLAWWAVVLGFAVGAAASCGSGDDSATSTQPDAGLRVCAPGQSVSCTGSGGCNGGQVCNESGTGYGACDCGQTSDSGDPSSDGGDGGVEWTPKELSGLVLWIDGKTLGADGTAITTWADQSGSHHDLVAAPSTAPVVDKASELNGLPAARFDRTSLQRIDVSSAAFAWGSDAFLVEEVVRPTDCISGVTTCGYFNFETPTQLVSVDDFPGQVQLRFLAMNDAGTEARDALGSISNVAGHVLGIRRKGATTAELRVDGIANAVSPDMTNAHPLTGTPEFSVGYANDTGDPMYLTGDIAEVVVVHVPTDEGVAKLEAYLKAKYAL